MKMKRIHDNHRVIAMLLCFASVILSGCTTSYPGETYDVKKGEPTATNTEGRRTGTKEQILVYVNNQNYDAGTRGMGPFESEGGESYNAKLAKARFYIFAFRHGYYKQGNYPSKFKTPSDVRKYFLAKSNTPGTSFYDAENDDCLVDGTDYNAGLEMTLNVDQSVDIAINGGTVRSNPLTPVESGIKDKMYFNFSYPTLSYDFFGYYVDDVNMANAKCHRESNRIWFENFTITGSQDVLCGQAPLLTRSFLNDNYAAKVKSLSKLEIDTIVTNGGYSSFTASCDIVPQIAMKHQMAYLKFIAVPCDTKADSIFITGIRVESPTKGNFTVASRNTDNPKGDDYYPLGIEWDPNSLAKLSLLEASVNGNPCLPLDTTKYGLKCTEEALAFDKQNGGSWIVRANESYTELGTKRIGGCLLLPPSKSYVIYLDYKQILGHDSSGKAVTRSYTSQYTLSNDFKAGNVYSVQIGVFGVQKIEVGLGIENWGNGGTISIDPDNADSEGY